MLSSIKYVAWNLFYRLDLSCKSKSEDVKIIELIELNINSTNILYFQLESIDIKQKHNREFFGSLFILMAYQITVISGALYNRNLLNTYEVVHSIPVENVSFFVIMFCSKSYAVLCMSSLLAVNNRLRLINRVLTSESMNFVLDIKQFLTLHDKLCDTVTLINRCFSITFLLNISECVFHCIYLVFNLYTISAHESTVQEMIFLISGCIYVVPESVFVLFIIIFSSVLKTETNRTFLLLHDSRFSSSDADISKFHRIASLQLDHRKPFITCGLFVIDWVLLFAIVAAIFSFLVILIQFDTADGLVVLS